MNKLCPLLKKPCVEHDCTFWTHITGMHPQTGANVDCWDCTLKWIPIMLVEQTRMTRTVAASVDSARNEIVERQEVLNAAVSDAREASRLNHERSGHFVPDVASELRHNEHPTQQLLEDEGLDGKDTGGQRNRDGGGSR